LNRSSSEIYDWWGKHCTEGKRCRYDSKWSNSIYNLEYNIMIYLYNNISRLHSLCLNYNFWHYLPMLTDVKNQKDQDNKNKSNTSDAGKRYSKSWFIVSFITYHNEQSVLSNIRLMRKQSYLIYQIQVT